MFKAEQAKALGVARGGGGLPPVSLFFPFPAPETFKANAHKPYTLPSNDPSPSPCHPNGMGVAAHSPHKNNIKCATLSPGHALGCWARTNAMSVWMVRTKRGKPPSPSLSLSLPLGTPRHLQQVPRAAMPRGEGGTGATSRVPGTHTASSGRVLPPSAPGPGAGLRGRGAGAWVPRLVAGAAAAATNAPPPASFVTLMGRSRSSEVNRSPRIICSRATQPARVHRGGTAQHKGERPHSPFFTTST